MTSKTEQIASLERLLVQSPRGITRAEIGRQLGVHRATAARYLEELREVEPVQEVAPGRFSLRPQHYLPRLRVSIHEATALYLAAELMSEYSSRYNPHATIAIRAIGRAFDPIAPAIAATFEAEADRLERRAENHRDDRFVHGLETITQAWAERRVVDLLHFSTQRSKHEEYSCGIDGLVPYAAGNTIVVVATTVGESIRRTFRLDHIRAVSLREPAEYYQATTTSESTSSWGALTVDHEPVDVELRFSAEVAPRVLETSWHQSQTIDQLESGELVWRARIDDPREMYPWIRGWGAEVEIIRPAELRKEYREEIRRLARAYGV